MMKRKLLAVCFGVNLVMVLISFLPVVSFFLSSESLNLFVNGDLFRTARLILLIPVLILWGYSLTIWAKQDKKVDKFLLLLLLNGMYTPFYYVRMKRNGWI